MKTTALLALLPLAANADLLGPSWPAPTDLTGCSSHVAAAIANLTATLAGWIAADNGTTASTPPPHFAGISNLTFSLGVFSLHDPAAATTLQFHHTSPEIAAASIAAHGTRAVDGDSIYRVASVTKLLTVLAGLVALNGSSSPVWDRPLGDVVPGLVAAAGDPRADPVHAVAWHDVTLRALAAQLGGVPRDGFPNGNDLQVLQALLGADQVPVAAVGLPPLDNSSDPLAHPPCFAHLLADPAGQCPPDAYVASVAGRPPTLPPWTTPAYANDGFALLGLALANVTGYHPGGGPDTPAFEDLVHDRVLAPLGMASSGLRVPPPALWPRAVIASSADPARYFNISTGLFAASGAALASANDLARLGIAILNHTLLAPVDTRRWLQPVAHTARLQYAVGAPWEIHRFSLPSGKVVDLYTKSGDAGAYSAFFVLLPDYGAGFTLLSAASPGSLPAAAGSRFALLANIADAVAAALVPALERQAATETAARFAGTYTNPARNASLTLALNHSASASPGLLITRWTSNGTNLLSSPLVDALGLLPWRLVPSIANPPARNASSSSFAFRLLTATDAPAVQPPVGPRLFAGRGFLASDWLALDALVYGGIPLSQFVFSLDANGTATAVSPAAFRMTLQRVC